MLYFVCVPGLCARLDAQRINFPYGKCWICCECTLSLPSSRYIFLPLAGRTLLKRQDVASPLSLPVQKYPYLVPTEL